MRAAFAAHGLTLRPLSWSDAAERAPLTVDVAEALDDGVPVSGGLLDPDRFEPHGLAHIALPMHVLSAFELPSVCAAQDCAVDRLVAKLLRPDSPLVRRLAPLMLDRVLVPDPSWRSDVTGAHNLALSALLTATHRVRRLLGHSAPSLVLNRERRLLMGRVWQVQTVGIVSCAHGAGLLDDAPTLALSVAQSEQREPGSSTVGSRTYPWRVEQMVEWLPELVARSTDEARADWVEVLTMHGYRWVDS